MSDKEIEYIRENDEEFSVPPHHNARTDIDWAAVKLEYGRGFLSVDQLAEKFNIPRTTLFRRIKQYGWSKSLGKQIAEAAAEKVIRDVIAEQEETGSPDDEQDFIDKGVDVLSHVNKRHRRWLEMVSKRAVAMLDELSDPANDLDLVKRAQVLDKLSGSVEKVIKLERQAFGMDAHQNTDVFEGKGIKIEFVEPQ